MVSIKFSRKSLNNKKYRKTIIILLLIVLQLSLSLIQVLRYDVDNYNCVDMSKEMEYLLESLGLNVYQVTGFRYKDAKEGGVDAHRWILIDIGFTCIPFESTLLLPLNPNFRGFKNIRISKGFIENGVEVDLEWEDWY
jgi:hypothetical protein